MITPKLECSSLPYPHTRRPYYFDSRNGSSDYDISYKVKICTQWAWMWMMDEE
jgi:hypothetical protein